MISKHKAGCVSLAILLFCLLVPPASAQAPTDSTRTEDTGEAVLESLVEDDISADPTVLLEALEQLRESPLDINAATADELAEIPYITPLLAERIVRHRTENGPFTSIPGLRLVEGMDEGVYSDSRPFLTIGARLAPVAVRPSAYPRALDLGTVARGLRFEVRQRVQRRLDLGRGYRERDTTRTAYLGTPERLYTRLSARYRRNVSVNLTLEKDPGERLGFDGQVGFDYLSAHLALRQSGRIDALVVGDFALEYGQGVALWRAGGFGKGREAVRPLVKNGRGPTPYGSVEENQFFRGAAASIALAPWLYASAFASRRTLDASTLALADPTTLAGEEQVGEVQVAEGVVATSLAATGFHRTPGEVARKDALGETLGGGGLEVRRRTGTLAVTAGVVGYHARFDAPIQRGDRAYQAFRFDGQEATMVSAYGSVKTRAFEAFGETARAPTGALGGLGGAIVDLDALELIVVARHYPRDFVSLHGYGFGERNGATQNETGVYTGLRLAPSARWTVSAFYDQYRFPWATFSNPRPATGSEALLFVEHRPVRWLQLYAQARTETRDRSSRAALPTGGALGSLGRETRQSLRLHGSYAANRRLRLRARAEVARYRRSDGEGDGWDVGTLLYQDVRYSVSAPLQLDARLLLFDTDSYNARLYAFENDVFGVLSNPVFSGQGTRFYLLVRYNTPLDGLQLQAKLAQTRFAGRERVGSGLNEIEGDTVRDLTLQVRYVF